MARLLSHRLFHTIAFRAALLYACIFSLLAAAGMGFIYWSTKNHIVAQVDTRLQLETELLVDLYHRQAMPALLDTVRRRSSENSQSIFFYLIWGPNRGWLAGLPPARLKPINFDHPDIERRYATLRLGDVFQLDGGEDNEWVRVLSTTLPGDYRLLVGRDLNEEKNLLDHTLTVIFAVAAVVFLLALAISLALGRRSLMRIDAISRTAGEFMAGDLSKRLPLRMSGPDDEFEQLSRKLNAMLERIEQLLHGMRQVTDNIAHDLRKPLNRLRNRLEVTLLEGRTNTEYRQVLDDAISDADELLKTFNALLSIAQAEAGVRRNQWAQIRLDQIAEDLLELYDAHAEQSGVALSSAMLEPITITGNRQLVAQAIGNLLDNAIKYTPAGGQVRLECKRTPQYSELTVADSGPGIPPEHRKRVLERFVRLDNARSQAGNGLGLSLVRAVATLHAAELELVDNQPGLRAVLRFANEL